MYYSKATGGFYDPTIHGANMPPDVREISREQHAALMQGQAEGKQIVADSEGRPVLQDRPAPTHTEAAAIMWERIKAHREHRTLTGGYQVAGSWFHSDTFSRTQQVGLVLMGAGMPAGIKWKTMSGSFVNMSPQLAQQVLAAAAAQDDATFKAAEAHRQAMEALPNPMAYDFSAGWPMVFGE